MTTEDAEYLCRRVLRDHSVMAEAEVRPWLIEQIQAGDAVADRMAAGTMPADDREFVQLALWALDQGRVRDRATLHAVGAVLASTWDGVSP